MEQKPFLKQILGGLLGQPKVVNETPSTPTQEATVPPIPKVLPSKSEAYLNRRKGRKKGVGHYETIVEYLKGRGEVSPGEMVTALKIPKSSLVHNLNYLISYSQGIRSKDYHFSYQQRKAEHVLKGYRLEKVGAGKYVRYRLKEASGNSDNSIANEKSS
jgi:hypothetical protein